MKQEFHLYNQVGVSKLKLLIIEEQARMTQVVLGENEGIDSALRRFKRQVSKAGILADVKYHRHFETPLEKRKRKAVAARRKRRFK